MNIIKISVFVMQHFITWSCCTKQYPKDTQVFAAIMTDIQKALESKKKANSHMIVFKCYQGYLGLFEPKKVKKLLSHWSEDIDHKIDLVWHEDKESKMSWELLYNMITEELVILWKTLTDLLNKRFIQVSHLSAAASVLFIQKSERGLQFCVNYQALNAIIKKNCYSLLLIHETLNQIEWAKWFIKLNMSAAFHKIQITVYRGNSGM